MEKQIIQGPNQGQNQFQYTLTGGVQPQSVQRLSKSIVIGSGDVISQSNPVLTQNFAHGGQYQISSPLRSESLTRLGANAASYQQVQQVAVSSNPLLRNFLPGQSQVGEWTPVGQSVGGTSVLGGGLSPLREGLMSQNQGGLVSQNQGWVAVNKPFLDQQGLSPLRGGLVSQTQGQQYQVSYQLQPVKTVSYVTVPVNVIEYVKVPVAENECQCEGEPQAHVEVDLEAQEEIKKLRLLLKEKDEHIVNLRTQNEHYVLENKSLWSQAEDWKRQLEEAKDLHHQEGIKRKGQGEPNAALIEELELLKGLLNEKNAAYKKMVEEYETRITTFGKQVSELKGRITQITSEYETRITTIISEKEGQGGSIRLQYEETIRGQKGKIEELHARLVQITSEYESRISTFESRVSGLIREKETLMIEITTLRGTYESQIIVITKERDGLLLRIKEFERIIETLRIEIETCKGNLLAYENKIAILSGELNRVKSLNTGKGTEIEELRKRTLELETSNAGFSSSMMQYESHIKTLSMKCENSLALVVCLFAEIDGLRSRYVERVNQ